jgi:3-hydroxybutyryl-CoA dehydrogenase
VNDAVHALSEGVARAADIDTAMKLGANVPMGPLALADLIGLDVTLAVIESLHRETADPRFRPATRLRQLVRAGKLGRKTGEGFHRYE